MAEIERDTLLQRHLRPEQDETIRATFRADRAIYWKGHLIMALVIGLIAGTVLLWIGNPYPVLGPIGAALAIAARGAFLASEALTDVWVLTGRRLLGPAQRSIPLSTIAQARPFWGTVQIVTKAGDRHLIKYLGQADEVAAQIRRAAGIAP